MNQNQFNTHQIDNAISYILKKFREKMKEIIRSDYKIEQVCNIIDPFGKVTNKEFLLKHWPSFTTKFEKHMVLIIQFYLQLIF